MTASNGTNQELNTITTISKAPTRASKQSADTLESDKSPTAENTERPSKLIRTENDEFPGSSQHVSSELSSLSVVRTPRPKRPLAEFELDTGSLNDDNTPELEQCRSQNDKSLITSAGEHKRARHVETISADNSKGSFKALLLPVELHDLILEQLWDDPYIECHHHDALFACAKVCSRWRAAARPHIFRSILIENERNLHRLGELVRADPRIATWMHKVCISGDSLKEEYFPKRLREVEQDRDRWIYQFPSVLGVTPPNVKILELMHFTHLSPLREDQEAFSHWIPHLAQLQSVEHLYMFRCQMSSNAMTAMVRALPRLATVLFCESDFTAPNTTCLCDKSSSEGTSNSPAETSHSSRDDPEVPVHYPLIYPSPALQFFAMGNDETSYPHFEFETLCDMLDPKVLSQSLISLHLGNEYDDKSLSEFLASLGLSPALEYLKICIVDDLESTIEVGKQVSSLRNLKTLRLWTPLLDHDQSDIVRQFLTFLDSPRLQTLTIIVPTQDPIGDPKVLDEYLASDKFKDLDKFSIDFMDDLRLYGTMEDMEVAAQAMFPLMAKRGILCVEDCEMLYPYWAYF
ncbi:unnamed protein product [Somion occarium]|uniref:F-box domain-containing protein n=1 Tax=Somion occarium TaxID=3059160 RepID=A0ABP1DPY4_9APHY